MGHDRTKSLLTVSRLTSVIFPAQLCEELCAVINVVCSYMTHMGSVDAYTASPLRPPQHMQPVLYSAIHTPTSSII